MPGQLEQAATDLHVPSKQRLHIQQAPPLPIHTSPAVIIPRLSLGKFNPGHYFSRQRPRKLPGWSPFGQYILPQQPHACMFKLVSDCYRRPFFWRVLLII